jgi:SpoVK/Ycf46/Vps4 family AAA+-type ATPase
VSEIIYLIHAYPDIRSFLGTGKTTTARKMGQVYYDMGFLSSAEVIECSATDLVGEYVGQTGPKTKQVFERALGKVLFVDEAYRLSEGPFAKEAMDELVGILTQEAFIGKLIVILAGYDKEMNALLAVNTGLSSRFPEEIYFENMQPEACLKVLQSELKKKDIHCDAFVPASTEYKDIINLLSQLSSLPSWGNARDMKTLAKHMIRVVYKKVAVLLDSQELRLSGQDAVSCLSDLLSERLARSSNLPSSSAFSQSKLPVQHLDPPRSTLPPVETDHETRKRNPDQQQRDEPDPSSLSIRDLGVSDAIWAQLQVDQRAAAEAARRQEEEMRALEKAAEEARLAEEAQKALEADLARRAREAAADAEVKRQLEQQRLKRLAAAIERERKARELEARRQKEIEEKRREAKAQEQLRRMGVCPAGYNWIKQAGGYRCTAGGHFVTNAQLGM